MTEINAKGLSRRAFFGLGATAAAGAAVAGLAGCSPAPQSDAAAPATTGDTTMPATGTATYEWEIAPEPITDIASTVDTDILVIGAGLSGCACAAAAAEKGGKVTVVEKTGSFNGRGGGFGAINGGEWMKVVYGILLSTLLGFFLGWANSKIVGRVCRNMDRKRTTKVFRWAQVASGAGVAFMHGAQDGQKFMSLCMLGIMIGMSGAVDANVEFPFWLIILVSATMALGTAVGGKKIIKSVGMDMVKLEAFQGFAASLSTFVSLMLATFGGLPVSTTHTNTTAIMGVGAAKNPKSVKWSIAIDMVKTWVLTFPGCGILGFACAKLFLMIL